MSFFEIFQPGLEYLRREKDRYKMLVSKPTHGGGAPLGIDLDAGIAKIRIPPRSVPDPEPAPAGEPAPAAEPEADPESVDDRPAAHA